MTTNQDRAAEVIGEAYQQAMESDTPSAWRGSIAQALADAGLIAPYPNIIRTIEELKALDSGTYLANRDRVIMAAFDWEADYQIDPVDMFPIVVIATGERVRAACEALEES